MSEHAVNETSASPELDKAIAEAAEKFAKKDKLVALPTDDQEVFVGVVSKFQENLKDWTDGADASVFTGMALAKSENGRISLIPLASMEAVFADPIVRKALYKSYVNRVVNAAMEDDANPASFLTVAGNYKQKFDLDAFNFIAKPFIAFLRKGGLSGITKASLRQSFASAAFAKTQFPRTTDEQWAKILEMAKVTAKKNDFDISIFEHWEATRAVQSADTSVLNIDFTALSHVTEDDDEEEAANPAPAPASA